MTSLTASIASRILRSVVARICPSRIPRSGVEGQQVNCYIVRVRTGDEPPPLVTRVTGPEMRCLRWDGQNYNIQHKVSLLDVRLGDFEITHYYGLDKIRFSGLSDLVISRVSCWPYLKIHARRPFRRGDQYAFNRRKLHTKKRMELLQAMIDLSLDGNSAISIIDLMTALYSIRWLEHPDRDAAERNVGFYLDGMVATGELKQVGGSYEVAGDALKAIEEYEEQERKHAESVSVQRGMLWLTLVIAMLAAIQAGLIRLPTLLDLAEQDEISIPGE